MSSDSPMSLEAIALEYAHLAQWMDSALSELAVFHHRLDYLQHSISFLENGQQDGEKEKFDFYANMLRMQAGCMSQLAQTRRLNNRTVIESVRHLEWPNETQEKAKRQLIVERPQLDSQEFYTKKQEKFENKINPSKSVEYFEEEEDQIKVEESLKFKDNENSFTEEGEVLQQSKSNSDQDDTIEMEIIMNHNLNPEDEEEDSFLLDDVSDIPSDVDLIFDDDSEDEELELERNFDENRQEDQLIDHNSLQYSLIPAQL